MLTIGLRRIGAVLGLSLLGLLAGSTASVANEGWRLADRTMAQSGGLSTDLLESDPLKRPVPVEEIPVETLSTEEIPEEILRTEIITGARSPLTGEAMTAAEYAQLQEELDNPIDPNMVSSDLRYLVFLLQVRRAIKPILPFIR